MRARHALICLRLCRLNAHVDARFALDCPGRYVNDNFDTTQLNARFDKNKAKRRASLVAIKVSRFDLDTSCSGNGPNPAFKPQAIAAGHTCDVYTSTFTPMKISLAGRVEKAFMKLIVDVETDKVVGCHMVGPDSAEIMQGLGIALKCGATKKQFDSTVGIHPSSAEEFVTMREATRRVSPKVAAKVSTEDHASLHPSKSRLNRDRHRRRHSWGLAVVILVSATGSVPPDCCKTIRVG